MKRLADLAGLTLGPALAAQGFAGREIVARWPDIVGERLAGHCRPIRIDWPKRRPGPEEEPVGAALILRVESAFALEAQQLTPLILQRVNVHLGWLAVDRLVLKQGPVEAGRDASAAPVAGPPPAAVAAAVAPIEHADLREALERLGTAISGRKPPQRR